MSFFLTELAEKARRQPCSVVLPEAQDSRILAAAARACRDGIAECILLGKETAIRAAAADANISLPADLRIVSPHPDDYIELLIQLRQARGKAMNEEQARATLANPVAVAAMLVHEHSAGAMVAGAVTPSADVLRPAMQILGLRPQSTLASSAFLMCFDDGMRVFSDCALNIAPDAAQLADIAVHSADTAHAFGLSPVIAMLNYTSGNSGEQHAAEHVHLATDLVKQRLPHLPVTGPIQYDAAVRPDVAAIKLPRDIAAGRANVLIFPDIQAGNIAYKAVQHASGIVSIGPLMQGMAAVANDLSRGASAEDIYYTIAATVVQTAALAPQ